MDVLTSLARNVRCINRTWNWENYMPFSDWGKCDSQWPKCRSMQRPAATDSVNHISTLRPSQFYWRKIKNKNKYKNSWNKWTKNDEWFITTRHYSYSCGLRTDLVRTWFCCGGVRFAMQKIDWQSEHFFRFIFISFSFVLVSNRYDSNENTDARGRWASDDTGNTQQQQQQTAHK